MALAASPEGTVLVVAKAGLGLQRVIDGRLQAFDTPAFRGSSLVVTTLGWNVKVQSESAPAITSMYRIYRQTCLDRFDATGGLSGDSVTDLTEDREGNVWVVTGDGV